MWFGFQRSLYVFRRSRKFGIESKEVTLVFTPFLFRKIKFFRGNIKLKSLTTAIVQVGLYDRYVRRFKEPDFIMGPSSGDAAMEVALGLKTLEELVSESKARDLVRPSTPLQIAETPILSGITLADYACYQFDVETNRFAISYENSKDFNGIVHYAIDEKRVKKFINIGPGNSLLNRQTEEFQMADIEILESIDLDPMLNWFWREVQGAESTEYLLANA